MDIHVSNIKKIDLILPAEEQHSWTAFFTKQLAASLEQLGIQARLLVPPKDKDPRPFLDDLFNHAPDCTICFNGILPDNQGRFLADLIQVPHFAILTESPNDYLSLSKSTFTTILSPDQQNIDILRGGGCDRTLFFPLAAPTIHLDVAPLKDRTGSILMAPMWIDAKAIQDTWKKQFPPKMIDFLEEVMVRSLSNRTLSYYHAFQVVMGEKSTEEQDSFRPWITFALFNQIEGVMRHKDVMEILTALQDFEVDLIVQKGLEAEWRKVLGNLTKKIRIYEVSLVDDILKWIGQTKIFLTSSPHFKFGTTGDLYTSLALGAYNFHNEADFLEWGYATQKGVYFYPFSKREEIASKAKAILDNPAAVQDEVDQGRKQVLENETWNARAKLLLDFISPIIAELPNQPKSMK